MTPAELLKLAGTPSRYEILDYLRRQDCGTSRDIAESLGEDLGVTQSRLTDLNRAGLLEWEQLPPPPEGRHGLRLYRLKEDVRKWLKQTEQLVRGLAETETTMESRS